MPRFQGIPVDTGPAPRFSGVPVEGAGINQPPGVPTYVPPGVEGYDPTTGEVAPGQNTSAIDKLGAFSSSVLNGVPVAGPYIKAGAERLGSMMSGESPEQHRYALNQATDRAVADNPYTAAAGGVTGAVAGTLPAMAAAPEAFGIGVASTPLRLMASAGSGATINAVDAGVRSGGDPNAMMWGGAIGGGLGLAAPLIAPYIGKGVQAIADNLQSSRLAKALQINPEALSFMRNAAQRDEIDPATAQRALTDMGADGMMLDLGSNLKNVAAGLVALPGEAKTLVKGAISARDAGANQRIAQTLDSTLGPAPIPSQINAGIATNQHALSPEYQAALRDAAPVDTLPIARYLDQEVQSLRGEPQRVVQRVRSMLDHAPTPAEVAQARANGQPPPGTSLVTDAGELLNTRHAIDDMMETTQGTNAINALTTARQAVDDELRASVPGIKEVDAKYAELARQREAVQRGQTVLSSGRESPRPAELAQEFQQGALPQGMQVGPSAVPVRLREGARAEIERIVGTNVNDRVALQRLIKGEGDWNRDRLTTLFGADRTNRIIDLLDREKQFADTSQVVTRNSETAARQAAQQELTGATDGGFGAVDSYKAGGVPGIARAAGVKGVERIMEALRGVSDATTQKQLAQSLTSNSPALLNALLASRPIIPTSQIDKVARALLLSGPSAARR